jgi:xanthine dehydrogenase accessory factor
VCDVWAVMATPERFPEAREVVVALPHEYLASIDPATLDARTAICVLTHDERLDVPAIATALRLPVGFVGAMGARTTVAHRERLLREAGIADVSLARLHSPLGLDLGGSSPDETAVSVLAEIVASRHGGSGLPLGEGEGPLHARDLTGAPRTVGGPTLAPAPGTTGARDLTAVPDSAAASCTPTRTAP